MPVILVLIVAVVWIAILAPNMMKRRAGRSNGISSISHFHRQLAVLEHSAPEPIVAPAYRLRVVGEDGTTGSRPGSEEGEPPVLTVVGADQLPKPALAFLGRDADLPAAEPIVTPPVSPPPRAPLPGRRLVRRRRRDILVVLIAAVITTFLLGFLPGADMAWVVCGLTGAALAAYVALLVRLRKLAEERAQKLRYLRGGVPVHDPDAAPGPPAVTGRFAHPAYHVSAAR
jgi:hypothetical protein